MTRSSGAGWLRRGTVLLAVLVLLLLAARFGLARFAEHRLESARAALREEVGRLDLATLRLPEVRDEDNAAHWIRRAAEAAAIGDDDPFVHLYAELGGRPLAEWSPAGLREASSAIAARAEALQLLARANEAPASTFGIEYERGGGAAIPDFVPILRLARLASLAARTALAEGDEEAFERNLRSVEAIAAALCAESMLVAEILGNAVDRMWLQGVADYLAAGYPDGELTARVQEAVEPGPCAGALRRAFRGEALLLHAASSMEGFAYRPRRPPALAQRLQGLWHAPWENLVRAALLDAQLRQLRALDRPWPEYLALYEEGGFRPRGPRSVVEIGEILTPNLVDAVRKARVVETSRGLAAAAFDVAAARRATGAFPESIELATTSYGGEVPRYTVHADRAEIVDERSEEAFERSQSVARQPPIFRWLVPAPAEAGPAG